MNWSRTVLLVALGVGYVTVTMLMVISLGLFGLVGSVVLGFAGWQVVRLSSGPSRWSPPDGVNCPECGARNRADDDVCGYCGATV